MTEQYNGFSDDFLSNGIYQLYRDEHEMDTPIDWSYYETTISDGLTRIFEPVPEFVEPPSNDPKSYSIIGEYMVPDMDVQQTVFHSFTSEKVIELPSSSATDDSCKPPDGESLHVLNEDDWDQSIENMLLDLDCTMSSADLPPQSLPDRTLFCNDSCDAFLRESSDGLTSYLNMEHDEFADNCEIDSDTSPDWYLTSEPDANQDDQQIIDIATPIISFPCTFGDCCKVYAKPAHLKAHLRRHVGDKPYICTWPECTWKFSRSDELSRHRRSHSGVKPYKCGYCAKCFARSDHLTKHRKVHERKMAKNNNRGGAETQATAWLQQVPPGRPGRRPKPKVANMVEVN